MIVKYIHHNVEVSTQWHLQGKHRECCLCFQNCKFFTPNNQQTHCEIAKENFALCIKYNVTTPVFECPKYESLPAQQFM